MQHFVHGVCECFKWDPKTTVRIKSVNECGEEVVIDVEVNIEENLRNLEKKCIQLYKRLPNKSEKTKKEFNSLFNDLHDAIHYKNSSNRYFVSLYERYKRLNICRSSTNLETLIV